MVLANRDQLRGCRAAPAPGCTKTSAEQARAARAWPARSAVDGGGPNGEEFRSDVLVRKSNFCISIHCHKSLLSTCTYVDTYQMQPQSGGRADHAQLQISHRRHDGAMINHSLDVRFCCSKAYIRSKVAVHNVQVRRAPEGEHTVHAAVAAALETSNGARDKTHARQTQQRHSHVLAAQGPGTRHVVADRQTTQRLRRQQCPGTRPRAARFTGICHQGHYFSLQRSGVQQAALSLLLGRHSTGIGQPRTGRQV